MARTFHHVDHFKVATAPRKWNACPSGKNCNVCGRWKTRLLLKRSRKRMLAEGRGDAVRGAEDSNL